MENLGTPTEPASAPSHESDYIDNWDEYWLQMAFTASQKSKDPRCRVGAVIVRDNVQLAGGFNGLARHVFDDPHVLADAEEKLRLICHAEENAILNAARIGVALEGATIYVTKFPCLACCNAIIQAGIVGIYTHDTRFWGDDPDDKDHSRKKSILRQARIKVDAPFHSYYAAKRVTKHGDGGLGIDAVMPLSGAAEASPKRTLLRKGKAKVQPAQDENMNLFQARRPSRGGKSGT